VDSSSLIFKMTTTIQISDSLWETLNKMKKKGETFEDVLQKLISIQLNKQEEKQNGRNTTGNRLEKGNI